MRQSINRFFNLTAIILFVSVAVLTGCAHTGGKKALTPTEQLQLARIYESRGEVELAMREYRRAIDEYGDNADAYFGMGNIHLRKREFKKAELNYMKAIRINPSSGAYYNNLAWLYLETNQPEKAEKEVRKAMKKDPGRRYVYLDTLGTIQVVRGELNGAEESFLEAATLIPPVETEGLKEIYRHLLDLYRLTNKADKAAAVEEKIKALQKGQ